MYLHNLWGTVVVVVPTPTLTLRWVGIHCDSGTTGRILSAERPRPPDPHISDTYRRSAIFSVFFVSVIAAMRQH